MFEQGGKANNMQIDRTPDNAFIECAKENAPNEDVAALREEIAQQGQRIDMLQKKVLSLYQVVDKLVEHITQLS